MIVIVVVSTPTGIGATLMVPVIVVTPFTSGPVIEVGAKVTLASAKLSVGAAPNPVPVTVTVALSPPFKI